MCNEIKHTHLTILSEEVGRCVDSGDGNNVDGDGYVEGDVDVDSVGDGDSDSACHWFFVESLRFLPGCAGWHPSNS